MITNKTTFAVKNRMLKIAKFYFKSFGLSDKSFKFIHHVNCVSDTTEKRQC
jgi:hypothetical protein